MLYNDPTQVPKTLLRSAGDIFSVVRSMDLSSISSGQGGWDQLLPLILGIVGIYFAIRSALGTFRFFARIVSLFVRYGSFAALLLGIVSWIFGGAKQGDLPAAFGNGPVGSGGQPAGLAGQAWGLARDWMQQQDNSKPQARRTRNKKDQDASGLGSFVDSLLSGAPPVDERKRKETARTTRSSTKQRAAAAADDTDDLTAIAQGWAKKAVLKMAGLEGWFGEGAEQQQRQGGRRAGAGAGGTRGR